MRSANNLRKLIKPLLGLGLLLIVLSQLQAEKLKSAFLSANWVWFSGAVLLALLANLVCALRWRKIIAEFDLRVNPQTALKLYFQGVTANTILPGGIIGGDIWRTLGLGQLGMGKLAAAKTVFYDRVSGFWALAVFACLALGLIWTDRIIQAPDVLLLAYGLAMVVIAVAPFLLLPIKSAQSQLILKTAAVSLLSQAFTIAAFAACLWSVGANIHVVPLAALCAGIFLGAVAPASIGGFGSREVASLFFLSALNVDSEIAFLASVLFGLTATLQGLVSLLAWVRPGIKHS